jgi:hypothetical protein
MLPVKLENGEMTVILIESRNWTGYDGKTKTAWEHAALSRVGIHDRPLQPYLAIYMGFGDSASRERYRGLGRDSAPPAEDVVAVAEYENQMVVGLFGLDAYKPAKMFMQDLKMVRDARADAAVFYSNEEMPYLDNMAVMEYQKVPGARSDSSRTPPSSSTNLKHYEPPLTVSKKKKQKK